MPALIAMQLLRRRDRILGMSSQSRPPIHPRLEWLRATDAGSDWLDRLPQLIEDCQTAWNIKLDDPFPYAFASIAMPATLQDGADAVLKIQFPDRESEHEAAALMLWNGEGAIKLLAYDPSRRALLLERCSPGSPLSQLAPDRALDVAVEIIPRLWKAAGAPFTSLADESSLWGEELTRGWERTGKPFERRLLDAALEVLRDWSGSQGDQVLLHQDLHADNILRAQREPWLVIDPKPLVGEREFSVVALVRGGELGDGPGALHYRLDRLSSDLVLDLERVRGWTIAQTLAWAFDGDSVLEDHIECARWLLGVQ